MGDPAVKGAVIFGRGRRLCGILIEPAVATSSEAEALASVWYVATTCLSVRGVLIVVQAEYRTDE